MRVLFLSPILQLIHVTHRTHMYKYAWKQIYYFSAFKGEVRDGRNCMLWI